MQADFEKTLQERKAEGLFRERKIFSPQTDGLVDFASSDYLGLSQHPLVKKACIEGVERFGVGSGGSAMVSGYHVAHQALEEKVAEFVGKERAILFPSGYGANLGIINALSNHVEGIFQDKNNHASLLDGAKLSQIPMRRYLHNDCHSLRLKLQGWKHKKVLIGTESVFSMEGDIAPLVALQEMLDVEQHLLMIDDAHGFGVLGAGRGCLQEYSLSQVPIYMATFSKALGGVGGFVAGDDAMIEMILQYARSYMYTTAMPPALAWANKAAIEVIEQTNVVDQLWDNIRYFTEQVERLGVCCEPNQSAIQAVVVGDAVRAAAICEKIKQQGFLVGLIRPPSVPKHRSLLRINVRATQTKKQIDGLLRLL